MRSRYSPRQRAIWRVQRVFSPLFRDVLAFLFLIGALLFGAQTADWIVVTLSE